MKFSLLSLLIVLIAGIHSLPHEGMEMDHAVESMPPPSPSLSPSSNSTSEPTTTSDLPSYPWSTSSGMHHGMPILEMPNLEPQQRLYWENYNTTCFFSAPASTKGFLWIHVFTVVAAWFFLYPVCLMFSVEESPYYIFLQTVQYAVVLTSLISLAIYSTGAPDLYPNNAYSKMSVILLIVCSVHWLAALVKTLSAWAKGPRRDPIDGAAYILANLHSDGRTSHDSGLGRSSGSVGSLSPSSTPHNDSPDADDIEENPYYDSVNDVDSRRTLIDDLAQGTDRYQERLIDRLMNINFIEKTVTHGGNAASVIFMLLNRPMFLFSAVYVFTGIVTGFCMGQRDEVFGILAHFIKGGVFFLFGLLTLGRYLGCFADQGMAWNIRPGSPHDPSCNQKEYRKYVSPSSSTSRVSKFLSCLKAPSMEFVECGLVLFYGSTNIFLEHLGNQDGKWSAKDLQHESIAFMYLGGGLCGVLAESPAVGRWLRKAIHSNNASSNEFDVTKAYSFNPFPAFIVFWTGCLMSQHHQSLPLATTIHAQWGYLLCIAAVFRLSTYALILTAKPQSTEPYRPFTELLTSFCLICGGMVFIESNSQTVEAMMYRGLDGMFTLNVSVCASSLIMAWEYVVMMLKGVARRRQ